jgi:hypothetical protein
MSRWPMYTFPITGHTYSYSGKLGQSPYLQRVVSWPYNQRKMVRMRSFVTLPMMIGIAILLLSHGSFRATCHLSTKNSQREE